MPRLVAKPHVLSSRSLGEGRREGAANGCHAGAGASSRRAFTLVELLVVIGIIGLLAALLTPAVMNARKSARQAAIKAEIDMLHMAIMNYKNEYGSFPPSASGTAAGSPMARHLQRLFPRCNNVPLHLSNAEAQDITPGNAIASWLKGYTTDPTSPLLPPNGRKKLFDFDQSRLSGGLYAPSGKPGSPYMYVSSADYGLPAMIPTNGSMLHPTASSSPPVFAHVMPDRVLNGVARLMPSWVSLLSPSDQELWYFTVSQNSAERGFQRPFNPDTFQILCAGADEVFGNDDDLSNFWPGTRKQYLESLSN